MTCVLGTSDGAELGSTGHEYAHAAMERTLASSGAALPPQWALQDLADCLKALQRRSRPRCARSGSAGEGARVDVTLAPPVTTREDADRRRSSFQYRPGAVPLATPVSLEGERYGQARPDSGQFAVA